jgi:RES domain-containing protein
VDSWATEPARISGRWHAFRQVDQRWPPLFHAAGEPRPTQEDGRWHRRGERCVQYLSLDPSGAWAEFVRASHLRDDERRKDARRHLWLIVVDEVDIADLSSFDRYEACGLDPSIAVDDHAPAQQLADALVEAGYRGVLSPSAALTGATNLSIFGERYEHVLDAGAGSWSTPNRDVWLPCSLAAEGAPPHELLTATRFQGVPHEGLASWRAVRP